MYLIVASKFPTGIKLVLVLIQIYGNEVETYRISMRKAKNKKMSGCEPVVSTFIFQSVSFLGIYW